MYCIYHCSISQDNIPSMSVMKMINQKRTVAIEMVITYPKFGYDL